MELEDLRKKVRSFSDDRGWEKFHSPKNLVMALTGEVGELSEIFQWMSEDKSKRLSSQELKEASGEMADVFIYLVRLFDVLDVDPIEASVNKLRENELKYPADLVYGDATKYNKRGDV